MCSTFVKKCKNVVLLTYYAFSAMSFSRPPHPHIGRFRTPMSIKSSATSSQFTKLVGTSTETDGVQIVSTGLDFSPPVRASRDTIGGRMKWKICSLSGLWSVDARSGPVYLACSDIKFIRMLILSIKYHVYHLKKMNEMCNNSFVHRSIKMGVNWF